MNACGCCGDVGSGRPSAAPASPPAPTRRRRTPTAPRPAPDTAGAAPPADDAHCRVLTLGHSTRPIDEFTALLRGHGVTRLLDVRTVPRSRHNPQFNVDALPHTLAGTGIGYAHVPGLGGFRRTTPDSPNAGWRNLSFRGYADYMQTPAFADELARLIELASRQRVALMCAEAVPWRCHRSLIADALLVHGVPSCEIASPTRLQPHKLTRFAHVRGESLTYPSDDAA